MGGKKTWGGFKMGEISQPKKAYINLSVWHFRKGKPIKIENGAVVARGER